MVIQPSKTLFNLQQATDILGAEFAKVDWASVCSDVVLVNKGP